MLFRAIVAELLVICLLQFDYHTCRVTLGFHRHCVRIFWVIGCFTRGSIIAVVPRQPAVRAASPDDRITAMLLVAA